MEATGHIVFERKPNQRIFIGDDIIVEFICFRKGEKILVGITAPLSLRVDREEIHVARQNPES